MGTVYRIQSKQDKTRGAYRSHDKILPVSGVVRELCNTHAADSREHPSPMFDKGLLRYPEENEHCGFNSAADLLRWFKGWLPDLLRAGYEIVALRDVTITAIGEYQVLFTWES